MEMPGCDKAALQQVNQFWSILDDLSAKNPEEYRKFIERQLREGAELYSKPPQPHACIRTDQLGPKKGVLYLNICGWKRVPAPTSHRDPIPLCGGRLETITEQKEYSVVDVAFNPKVLQIIEKDKEEREKIHLLVLNFIQQQHNLNLSQSYKLTTYRIKGSIQDMKQRLMSPKQIKSTANEPQSEPAPSLLQQISSLRLAESKEDSSIQLSIEGEKPARPGLIEVISSTESVQPEPKKPRHHLTVCTDSNGSGRSLTLNVELPSVRSVSQCQLNISQDDILLEVEDIYYLHLPLPELVKEETCTATFNKKERTLTVTVIVL